MVFSLPINKGLIWSPKIIYFPFLKGRIFEDVSSQGKFFKFTSSPIIFKLFPTSPSSINNFVISSERLLIDYFDAQLNNNSSHY